MSSARDIKETPAKLFLYPCPPPDHARPPSPKPCGHAVCLSPCPSVAAPTPTPARNPPALLSPRAPSLFNPRLPLPARQTSAKNCMQKSKQAHTATTVAEQPNRRTLFLQRRCRGPPSHPSHAPMLSVHLSPEPAECPGYVHTCRCCTAPTYPHNYRRAGQRQPTTDRQASKQASARVERMNGWLAGWPQLPTIYMYVKCEVRLLARPTAVSTCQPPPRHPAANRGAPRQHPTIITFRFVWHQHQRRHKASVQSVVRARCSPPTPSMACTVRRLCCAAPPPILLLLVCCLSVCRTDTHAMRNPRR